METSNNYLPFNELQFAESLILAFIHNGVFKFNIYEAETILSNYDSEDSRYEPLFQNIRVTCNRIDISEAIWELSSKSKIYLNYPYVEIKPGFTAKEKNPYFTELMDDLVNLCLMKKRIEESSPIPMRILNINSDNSYSIAEGYYYQKIIRWEVTTDGIKEIHFNNITSQNITVTNNDDEYKFFAKVSNNYLTVKKSTYVIHKCYIAGELVSINIYTTINDEAQLEAIRDLALTSANPKLVLKNVR